MGDMKFVSLHHHTTHSYKDGYGTPDEHHARAAELGMAGFAATEHGNVNSHVQHEQAAAKYGTKAIFGCELYTGGVSESKRTQRKNHLTVLAESQRGYQSLLRMVSGGWAEGFYYEPTVSTKMLRKHAEGLIVLSGCSGSLLACSLLGGKNIEPDDASPKRGRKVAEQFRDIFGDNYYLEVQAFPELERSCNINQGVAELSKRLKIPMVATMDVHYTKPDESDMQMILHNVRGGMKKSLEQQAQEWGYDVKLTPPVSDKWILKRLIASGLTRSQASQAIVMSAEIAGRCDVTLPKVENLRYPLPAGTDDPVMLFRRWMDEGWKYRGFNKLKKEQRREYEARVKYEMELIEEKGFVDYFLVVSDAVKFAKDSGIPVGPARGSAAASLVCYLLRITEVNPMPFPTLLFERFIDRNRHDLPDIDLDFDDERRGEVREYLVAKYGHEKVGNIGTFTHYKGKNSLDDVARVFKVPPVEVERLKGLLIERSSGDLRANATIEDTCEMFKEAAEIVEEYPELRQASRLEGNVRDMSVHAAGIVIADSPLSDFCAVYTRTNSKGEMTQVVSLDKHDAEYLNVMKLDLLGLKTMAMIRIALEQIGMTLEELYSLPLTDEETIRGFRSGDVVGIFQFDGRAMRSVNSGVIPDNFMEVCDINALARPGPLHSGATAEYMDVKHGRKDATHYHELVDEITKHTQFQIVYQEQILKVVRELGNFSWEEAARIRKIISKKRGQQEFNQQRDKFIAGAKKHDMGKKEADRVFSLLATAGAYAFNAAHCVSYGMLAYWTMWLKQNHPLAFYVACLRKYEDKEMELLRDARRHGIKVKKLNVNESDVTWADSEGALRPGFVQVKGIGDVTAQRLVEERIDRGEFSCFAEAGVVHGIGPKTVQLMEEFANTKDPFGLDLLSKTIGKVRKELRSHKGIRDGNGERLPTPTHTSADVPYERQDHNLHVVWLGVVTSRNLKDLFENYYSRTGKHLDTEDTNRPDLKEWVVMYGEDDTEPMVITADRFNYRKFKARIWDIRLNQDLVLIKGFKYGVQSRRAIYIRDMWILEP